MSDIYTRAAETATRLLAEKGKPVTLWRVTSGTYNTATGKPAAATLDFDTINGVLLQFASKDIDGTLVKATDRYFLLAPKNTDGEAYDPPKTQDKLNFTSQTSWFVVGCETIAPTDVTIALKVHVRK